MSTVIFPKWTNQVPTMIAVGSVFGLVAVILIVTYYFSPKNTDVGYAPVQPVPYSHKLHAGLLGIDCRYCHYTVDHAAHAAIPATEVCMNCHKQVKTESEVLAPVRESYATGESIPWVKVHMLPDYAYFDHSLHINAGVGCSSCHGRIDQMEVVRQDQPLSMGWCLECHRNPEPHIRPAEHITTMDYFDRFSEEERLAVSRELIAERQLNPPEHCSACHR